jgi:hypothetical protein
MVEQPDAGLGSGRMIWVWAALIAVVAIYLVLS